MQYSREFILLPDTALDEDAEDCGFGATRQVRRVCLDWPVYRIPLRVRRPRQQRLADNGSTDNPNPA